MKLITKRDIIIHVAERWRTQYLKGRANNTWYKPESQATYERLCALDLSTANDNDIETIIGNKSWTTLTCHECNASSDALVECGQEPDYESSTAKLCRNCLVAALSLIGNTR